MNIPEELLPVVEWWEKDGKKTLAIAAVAGVAAIGIWSWRAHAAAERDAAAAALAGFGDADSLQEAVDKYGSLDCGPMLKLKLAAAYFGRAEDGDVERALEIYESLVKDGSSPQAFAGVAAMGRAECLEALERWSDAAKAYGDFVASAAEGDALALSAKLGLARSMSQNGQKDEAVKNLEALKKEFASDNGAVARIDAALDVVKRWTKRPLPVASEEAESKPEIPEKPATVAPVAAPAATPAPSTPAAPATPAPAPAPAPAAPAVKDASDIKLPSAK